jgi:hypothetical protein
MHLRILTADPVKFKFCETILEIRRTVLKSVKLLLGTYPQIWSTFIVEPFDFHISTQPDAPENPRFLKHASIEDN